MLDIFNACYKALFGYLAFDVSCFGTSRALRVLVKRVVRSSDWCLLMKESINVVTQALLPF